MITAALTDLSLYKKLGPNLAIAIDYILGTDFSQLGPGRYEVVGESVFAIVNEYVTKPAAECEPESHRDYIDIQVMLEGSEKFGYAPLLDNKPSTGFLPGNDVAFYTLSGLDYITLYPRPVYPVFPSDIHQPELFTDQPRPVKKLVMKVKVS